MNVFAILTAAAVPMIIGFIWYNEKVFGKIWMEASGMTKEKAAGANMFVVFGLSILCSLILAASLQPVVIHQMGVFSSLYYALKDPARMEDAKAILAMFQGDGKYAHEGRTFHHGALHGFILATFVILPIFATNALFERRSFKYVAVNIGYWMVSLSLMGGILGIWE